RRPHLVEATNHRGHRDRSVSAVLAEPETNTGCPYELVSQQGRPYGAQRGQLGFGTHHTVIHRGRENTAVVSGAVERAEVQNVTPGNRDELAILVAPVTRSHACQVVVRSGHREVHRRPTGDRSLF